MSGQSGFRASGLRWMGKYQAADCQRGDFAVQYKVDVYFLEKDIWMSQAGIAQIYNTTPQNITMHIKNIYEDGELDEESTCKEVLQVKTEGTRQIKRNKKHYNFRMILVIGYKTSLCKKAVKAEEDMGKSGDKKHLPVYGVGPIYGASIIAVTVIGIILSVAGILDFSKVPFTKLPFIIVGIAVAAFGFWVWYSAAFRIDKYIKGNTLCTDGIYAWVRNPCYSGIMLMCTGALLMADNFILLILPVIYWIFMTVLMRNTEENGCLSCTARHIPNIAGR